ncbi:MAG TPA: alpha/beta hydrolase [Terriglobales bacterium]|nr:alpha/beta hydrolase [Terriglobales bacterium]
MVDILSRPQPPADKREAYGSDPNQFIELRLPRTKKPYPVLLNVHGGYWRAKYDLVHAGHLCEALRAAGVATFNVEYRRVGNPGGGWPGTFADVRSAYRYVRQESGRYHLDLNRLVVIGHSAGGQLALCLAAHETSLRQTIALAGVVDLKKAFALHLSHDAVVEFLGGTPKEVPEHYREADPMELKIPQAGQWLIHGTDDDTVPVEFSREYVQQKKKSGEPAQLIEIHGCGHFDLIDPDSAAFTQVTAAALSALA